MNELLTLSGLTKHYDNFTLGPLDLHLPGGAILGLIGENGAGKTTLLRGILGLAKADGGAVSLFGGPADAAARAQVGVVLDECLFHDSLRPRDLNAILAPAFPTWDRDDFFSLLDKYHLPTEQRVKEFSRGMKMKLSLAAALAHRPRLLLLDEATAGLDPVTRNEILDEFLDFIQDEDHSVLLSSHITSDLERVADYVAYLHRGQLVFCDPKDRILRDYGRVVCTARQLEEVDPGDLLRVHRGPYACQGLTAYRRDFAARYPDLVVEPTTLEEIMLLMKEEDEP